MQTNCWYCGKSLGIKETEQVNIVCKCGAKNDGANPKDYLTAKAEPTSLFKPIMNPDLKFLKEIFETSFDELVNDFKFYENIKNWEEELMLERMLFDYYKWSKKKLNNKAERKLYMEIIKYLEKELSNVRTRGKADSYNRGTLGYCLGRNAKEDRNSRNTNNKSTHIIKKIIRITPKRVYGLRRKNESGQEQSGSSDSL